MIDDSEKKTPGDYLAVIAGLSVMAAVLVFFLPAFTDAYRRLTGSTTSSVRTLAFSVDSTPDHAQVVVNGEAHGQTPSLFTLQCKPSSTVRVEVRLDGYEPWIANVACSAERSARITAKLLRTRE